MVLPPAARVGLSGGRGPRHDDHDDGPGRRRRGRHATNYADAVAYVAYVACVCSHGITDFPDPNSQRSFLFKGGFNGQTVNGVRIDSISSQFNSATKACQHVLPNGGQMNPAEEQQTLAQALKHSQCIRSHGGRTSRPATSTEASSRSGRRSIRRSPRHQ